MVKSDMTVGKLWPVVNIVDEAVPTVEVINMLSSFDVNEDVIVFFFVDMMDEISFSVAIESLIITFDVKNACVFSVVVVKVWEDFGNEEEIVIDVATVFVLSSVAMVNDDGDIFVSWKVDDGTNIGADDESRSTSIEDFDNDDICVIGFVVQNNSDETESAVFDVAKISFEIDNVDIVNEGRFVSIISDGDAGMTSLTGVIFVDWSFTDKRDSVAFKFEDEVMLDSGELNERDVNIPYEMSE